MNIINKDDAISVVQLLRGLHDETALFLNKHDYKPSPESTAFLEVQAFERSQSLWTAYTQGYMLIEVAADQLMAFTKTVTEPKQTIAPWTCVRAVLESCALATWLLDPSIKAIERVQRSITFRYEGLAQLRKFTQSSGDEADIAHANKQIKNTKDVALGIGLPRIQQMPPTTQLVTQTLNEESTYRLLSAMTHAHPWALIQLGFQRTNDEDINLPKSAEYIHFLEKTLKPESIVFLCATTAKSFVKPILFQSQLFGWETDNLKKIIDAAFVRIGISRR